MSKFKDNFTLRILGSQGAFIGSLVVARDLAAQLAHKHKMSQIGAYYAGEALVAALLTAADHTKTEMVTFRIEGDGAIKGISIDCSQRRQVRMLPKTTDPEVSMLELHFQKNQSPYGDGVLQITHQSHYSKNPTVGTTSLPFKGLAQNLTYFLSQSEQIQAAVGLYVELQELPPQPLQHAWGFLIKKLPSTSLDEVELMEKKIQALRIEDYKQDPSEIFHFLFEEKGFTILEEFELGSFCTCSKERYQQALQMLSFEEIKEITVQGSLVEIICEYCKTKYHIDVKPP